MITRKDSVLLALCLYLALVLLVSLPLLLVAGAWLVAHLAGIGG